MNINVCGEGRLALLKSFIFRTAPGGLISSARYKVVVLFQSAGICVIIFYIREVF